MHKIILLFPGIVLTVNPANSADNTCKLSHKRNFVCDGVVLCQDKKRGVEVVDLAKDPNTGGSLARSTTPELKLDKALDSQSIFL